MIGRGRQFSGNFLQTQSVISSYCVASREISCEVCIIMEVCSIGREFVGEGFQENRNGVLFSIIILTLLTGDS